MEYSQCYLVNSGTRENTVRNYSSSFGEMTNTGRLARGSLLLRLSGMLRCRTVFLLSQDSAHEPESNQA